MSTLTIEVSPQMQQRLAEAKRALAGTIKTHRRNSTPETLMDVELAWIGFESELETLLGDPLEPDYEAERRQDYEEIQTGRCTPQGL